VRISDCLRSRAAAPSRGLAASFAAAVLAVAAVLAAWIPFVFRIG